MHTVVWMTLKHAKEKKIETKGHMFHMIQFI